MERQNVESASPEAMKVDQPKQQELSLEEKYAIAPSICEYGRGCVKSTMRMGTGCKGPPCRHCLRLFYPHERYRPYNRCARKRREVKAHPSSKVSK